MTDSPSSFMDGHGTVQTRDPIDVAIEDLRVLSRMLHLAHAEKCHEVAYDLAGKIESLAAGLVQELTLLRDKEGK